MLKRVRVVSGRRRMFAAPLAMSTVVAAATFLSPALAWAKPDLDTLFDQAMERYQPAGMVVGVIEDGKVVSRRVGGELRAGEGQPVDADTLFKIASNSKAMTAAVLARLVDRGVLRWDDKVTKYLPEFRMNDPWVSENMQVRELLIHNSGLGSATGDMMLWPEPNHFSRADIINALAYFKPGHGFRNHYGYSNVMYVLAGEVASRAAGKPFDQLVREEVFQPLGMKRCQVGEWSRDGVGNVAQPHRRVEERNVVIREDGEIIPDIPMTAAGAIRCSLDDMLAWMGALLEPERHPDWLSVEQRRALWTLHVPMPITERMREWDGTRMAGYGYGWRLSDVDGEWKVAHTGTLSGMNSSMVLLPDRRSGFIMLINSEGGDARIALGQALTEYFTDPDNGADVIHYADLLVREREKSAATDDDSEPDASDKQPVPPQEFAKWQGHYRDAWFGDATICPVDDRVVFQMQKSPRMKGVVSRLDGRWLLTWDEPGVAAPAWLEFSDAPGAGMKLALSHFGEVRNSSNFGDLAFTRTSGCGAP